MAQDGAWFPSFSESHLSSVSAAGLTSHSGSCWVSLLVFAMNLEEVPGIMDRGNG